MPQILDSKCPIWGDEPKPDGTQHKYLDTWSFSLKTTETVKELEASVKAYGKQALNDQGASLYPDPDKNPLQCRYFGMGIAYKEHADQRSNDWPYWILHTNTVVPGSRNKFYDEQVQILEAFSAKAFVPLEVPTLSETLTTYFDRQIARRESLYQAGDAQNEDVHTYTRVQEVTRGCHLFVGGSGPSGVYVDNYYGRGGQRLGVAAGLML